MWDFLRLPAPAVKIMRTGFRDLMFVVGSVGGKPVVTTSLNVPGNQVIPNVEWGLVKGEQQVSHLVYN